MFRYPQIYEYGTEGRLFYKSGKRASPNCAFKIGEKVTVCLKIPIKAGTATLSLSLYGEGGEYIKSYKGVWVKRAREFDYYTVDLVPNLSVGLYFFEAVIKNGRGTLYAVPKNNGYISLSDKEKGARFQLSVSDFKYPAPNDRYGGTLYQIFTDRFSRGDGIIKKEGGIYPDAFDTIPEYPEYPGAPLKNNTLWGGNLSGISERLEYLSSLGVTMIYLTPIFESNSNHKYDTADYMKIDEGFGTEEDLRLLAEAAGKRGIALILDGVFNHTGADSVYFNKYSRYSALGAYNSKESRYYPWYEFKSYPDEYTSWWDIDILPRINPDSSDFKEFIAGEGGVIEKYTALGVRGFRLDVVDELSDDFVKSIRKRQASIAKNSFLYGEVWEDASNKIAYGRRKKYYLGDELDGVMNYPLRRGIIDFIMNRGDAALRYALTDVYYNAPRRIADFQMNLLSTHDTPRILTVLSDGYDPTRDNSTLAATRMSGEERSLAKKRLVSAYIILATVPGIPMIYYGDEAGAEGYSDPFNRLPYPYGSEDFELISHFQKIGRLRRHSVYKRGDFKLLYLDSELLIFARYTRSYAYLTVANSGAEKIKLKFSTKAKNILDGAFQMMYNLYKNESAVYKIRHSDTMVFKKENSDTI